MMHPVPNEIKVHATVLKVMPRPGSASDAVTAMGEPDDVFERAFLNRPSKQAAGKVVVAQKAFTNDVYICVGFSDDQHPNILKCGTEPIVGAITDLDKDFTWRKGADFYIDWQTGTVRIDGLSASFRQGIDEPYKSLAVQALKSEVARVLKSKSDNKS